MENIHLLLADKNLSYLEIARKMVSAEIWGIHYCDRWNKEIDRLMKKVSD